MRYELISWNVNGIRAIEKKGFTQWLERESPDVCALQEIKADTSQLSPSLVKPKGYHTYWHSAQRKGYSGVCVYTRHEPEAVSYGFGVKKFDCEGRVVILEYPHFEFINVYCPNGTSGAERLHFKLAFYKAFVHFLHKRKGKWKPIIVCGDFNTAHRAVDLARPKENETVSGFLPEERVWIDAILEIGLCDTFREMHSDSGHYTWWDYKTRARERNVGWRIDYFFIEAILRPKLGRAFMLPEILGSDHCPIGITVDV